MSFQTRVLLSSLLVLTLFGTVFGWFILAQFQTDLEAQTEQDLIGDARIVRQAWLQLPVAQSLELADEFANDMGQATQNRVTIIRADGTVVGDSNIEQAKLTDIESHADRPEVIQALDTKGKGLEFPNVEAIPLN